MIAQWDAKVNAPMDVLEVVEVPAEIVAVEAVMENQVSFSFNGVF